MDLKQELRYFQAIKADLLRDHAGKFALIKGEKFHGVFDTPDNAYSEGLKLFGQDIFLVKQILPKDEVCRNQALYLGIINARI